MADRARQLRYEWFLREFPHRQSVLRLAARTGLRADGGADSSGRRTGVSPRLSRAPAPGRRVHPERNLHKGVFPLERRKSTRLNSSHLVISYAVFCLKKNTTKEAPLRRRPRPPCR